MLEHPIEPVEGEEEVHPIERVPQPERRTAAARDHSPPCRVRHREDLAHLLDSRRPHYDPWDRPVDRIDRFPFPDVLLPDDRAQLRGVTHQKMSATPAS